MNTKTPDDLVAHQDGIRLTQPVFCIRFFTDKALSEMGPDALVPFEKYRELVGDEALRFYSTGTSRKHKPVTKRALEMPRTWLRKGAKLGDFVSIDFIDSENYNDAPSKLFEMSGTEEVDGERSDDATMFRLSLPYQWGIDKPGEMMALTTELWSALPFRSGLAGFALECTNYLSEPAQEHAYAKSMRHPGLEIPYSTNDMIMVGFHRVRGVGWLTLLEESFIEELGGRDRLQEPLTEDVVVHDVPRGVLIKAGDAPKFGDVNRKDNLPEYRSVYEAIHSLMMDPSEAPSLDIGGDFEARNEAWLTRLGS